MNQRVVRSGGAKLKLPLVDALPVSRPGARAASTGVCLRVMTVRAFTSAPTRPAARARAQPQRCSGVALEGGALGAKQGSKKPAALRGRRCPTGRDASST